MALREQASAEPLLAFSARLNFSSAGRAYWLAHVIAGPFLDRRGSIAPTNAFLAVDQAIAQARSELEELASRMKVRWQPLPLGRFLRTRVGALQDILPYARPEALRGYGALDPRLSADLARWQERMREAVNIFAEAVGAETVGAPPAFPGESASLADHRETLNAHQRIALEGFLAACARELILMHAYAVSSAPTTSPLVAHLFVSDYTEEQVGQILEAQTAIRDCLEALAIASGVSLSWRDAAADAIVYHLRQAEECIAFVNQAASRSGVGTGRLRELSDLYLIAHQVHLLAKNLQLLSGE